MSAWRYDVTPDAAREMLRGGGEFNDAGRLLNDLTAEQATALIGNAPYSIATLVAHTLWNIDQNLADAGRAEKPIATVEHLDDTFPVVIPEEWERLRERFLAALQRTLDLLPVVEGQPSAVNEDTSVLYDFAEMALHNAYHLGQIVLLRRIGGLWPPDLGDANNW